MKVPFLRPRPARLSRLITELVDLEESGIYSNFGPINDRFEAEALRKIFGGVGACLTVSNATVGLMIGIRHAIGDNSQGRRFALMPSFTFAAAAQAALWNNLTPLFCDIDAAFWTSSAAAEVALIERFIGQIAVIVPYATFGNGLDLAWYQYLAEHYGIPIVIDAAASLGSIDESGQAFGTGFPYPVVFSMHATKSFATAEGGIIYCSDPRTIAALRAMSNFGFAEPRLATLPGMNAKLSEVHALLALAKLREFDGVMAHRAAMVQEYRAGLDRWTFQQVFGRTQACTFVPILLSQAQAGRRPALLRQLAEEGIGVGTYFSQHLALHPYIAERSIVGNLDVTNDISRRIIVLPMSDTITQDEIRHVCDRLKAACWIDEE